MDRWLDGLCARGSGDWLSRVGPSPAGTNRESAAGPIVDELHAIITNAISQQASDVHFESGESHLLCRFRVDGVLVNRNKLDLDKAPAVLSRIKIMAGLDIAEKRRPQDGRIRFPFGDRVVDIRVSVIPTQFGEKAVLRLLDKQQLRLDLSSLGMTPTQQEVFRSHISLPNGIVLVTGPTGSGKTTTLYAALQYLKTPEVNISTVEDPIEYELSGINQTQVKPEIGLTFSTMLRALLRQDPNVIMVGEIRDRETLDMAIRASLTGHLVLSTIHTNSAVATVTRLLDMGAEPFLLASSLRLVVAQRLVRLLCPSCHDTVISSEYRAAARKLGIELGPGARSSRGCDQCGGTGFKGRTAIYELLTVGDRLRDAVGRRASEQQLLEISRSDSFSTMSEEAERYINHGLTSPGEVLRELTA